MAKRFVLISEEQFRAIVYYAIDTIPGNTFNREHLVAEFGRAQEAAQELINRHGDVSSPIVFKFKLLKPHTSLS